MKKAKRGRFGRGVRRHFSVNERGKYRRERRWGDKGKKEKEKEKGYEQTAVKKRGIPNQEAFKHK